jgi:hypothetical protein
MRLLVPIVVLFIAGAPLRAAGPGEDFFTASVRPILAKHCFKCHGPDDGSRKAQLRLDVAEEAVKPARSKKRAIVPGKPDQSELVSRIFAEDDSERMPPPHAKLDLSAEQKQILKRWITEGAKYTPHWSFVAPRWPNLPAVKDTHWPHNAIDRFILARLDREGLAPAPEADRYTLIRRLYLDLVGMPPTIEETAEFLSDHTAGAYERVVDRLLASPRYGERWARRWLDLARYADTNGYEKDRARSIWPYRDWVINALNADMPFDRFTIEQLAGDMLPGATQAQRIATGFHRNTMLNEEGGIDPQEFRFHAMTDRVATTGTTWLGMTIGCAQCHTHKYDPISHKEYYRFFAFLNNADEPELALPSQAVTARRKEILSRIAALEAELVKHLPAGKNEDPSKLPPEKRVERFFQSWHARLARDVVRWHTLHPVKATSNLPHLSIQKDDSIFASGDQSKSDTYEVSFQPGLTNITAIRLEVLPDERLPGGGPGRVWYEGPPGDFVLSEFTLLADGKPVAFQEATASHHAGASADKAIDGNPQTGWSINGGQGRAHYAIFRLREPLATSRELKVKLLFERYYSAGLGRFRISATSDLNPPRAVDFPVEQEPLLLIDRDRLSGEQRQLLLRQFLRMAPELAKARQPIDALRRSLPRHSTTLVLAERPQEDPRPTFIHHRGEFLQPRERVTPGVPGVLHALPISALLNAEASRRVYPGGPDGGDKPRRSPEHGGDKPRRSPELGGDKPRRSPELGGDKPRRSPGSAVAKLDRLAFARWLVSPDNPLVGRVTVNRQWAAFFGRGIVTTLGDFGLQGEAPSHPELLDWLALELIRGGWSMKHVHRLIVTSSIYRQSSRVPQTLLSRDPSNRLIARGPRVRLEAEVVRDSVLRASGLLADRLGGPSVFPPQPPGVTTEGTYGGLAWRVSSGLDRYRRGLYTFSKRTAPYALFGTFDGPSGEVCVARREVSNTPLQALTMLNDQVILESAQEMGRQAVRMPGTVAVRVEVLFRRVLTRPPTSTETALLVQFFSTQKKRIETKEINAGALAGTGEGDVVERAAWTALARVLFNLDEAIMKG